MLGNGNSLTSVDLPCALPEISQAVKQFVEKANVGCASDHDSDSEYACEAPDSYEEPSSCSTPRVSFEQGSDLQSVDSALSADDSSLPEVTLLPESVKWLKSKTNLKKIIHMFGLPNSRYSGQDVHEVCGQFGRVTDMLILFRTNEVTKSTRVEDSAESGATHMAQGEAIAGPSVVRWIKSEDQATTSRRSSDKASSVLPAGRFRAASGTTGEQFGRTASAERYGGVLTAPQDIDFQAQAQRMSVVKQHGETAGPSWAGVDDAAGDIQLAYDVDSQEKDKAAGDSQQGAVLEKWSQLTRRQASARALTLIPGSVPGPAAADKSIWVVGHSSIKWAEKQAAKSEHGVNLGFDHHLFPITWRGKENMRWKELLKCLNSMLSGRRCPDVLVIHLGENDFVAETGLDLMRAMKQDLLEIKRQWIGCSVIWTELIPRRTWEGANKPAAIDRARRKVNREMSVFCRHEDFGRIWHSEIKYNDAKCFRGDGVHLSKFGMNLYMLELREVLARTLNIRL
ncbi:uncharacterized protein [Pleurodeles waltl]|uniref:uncharacterized protein isoform X1 n=1 Tax=Pleurodeles waltl TaxID=8319 RepID=UPI0037099E0D